MISSKTIRDIAFGNLVLELSGEISQLKITVADIDKPENSITQYLPLDGHVENSVDDCIKYCIKK